MPGESSRRDFLVNSGAQVAGLGLGSSLALAQPAPQEPAPRRRDSLRVGFVGIGVKGSCHLGTLLRLEGVEVVAVCDVLERQCVEAQRQAGRLELQTPTAYFRGDRDYERMCAEEELDLVYTATPWEWHTPICLAAMNSGKHAATEIPAAVTLEECWQLVETSEQTGRHCVMMENVNYQRNEMAIWQMIRRGLLGELVSAEAGYMHDTRYLKSHDYGDGLWLADHHALRNGNLYPTHGLGPVCWYMNINRGDRLEYLVSMSSNPRGLGLYMQEHLPEGHPKREREYLNGDVNVCLIKTASGKSITLKHDTDLPRPYSRRNLVQGTRGLVRGFPKLEVCVEGNSHRHQWEAGDRYLTEYDHPLWQLVAEQSLGKFPGVPAGPITPGATWEYAPDRELRGGDFLEDYRLIEALRQGRTPDCDVYDAATWSVVAPLSEQSVAERSSAVDFPDFTKGRWQSAPPLTILEV